MTKKTTIIVSVYKCLSFLYLLSVYLLAVVWLVLLWLFLLFFFVSINYLESIRLDRIDRSVAQTKRETRKTNPQKNNNNKR